MRAQLDNIAIDRLRAILGPFQQVRYSFAFLMNRWASVVWEDDQNPDKPKEQPEPIENEAELVDWLIVPGPRKWSRRRNGKKTGSFGAGSKHRTEADRKAHIRTLLAKLQGHNSPDSSGSEQVGGAPTTAKARRRQRPSAGGRPRHDFERYTAVLLAEIFHEYTGKKPTRPNPELGRSGFYDFATACFTEVGLTARNLPSAKRQRCGKKCISLRSADDAAVALGPINST